jgi:NADH-quinone oxidoreductase subunit J
LTAVESIVTLPAYTPVESVVFWVAAISAVFSGIGVISARSPIYSALSLIITLAQLAILYLLLNAQFIAAAQVLIYAGAVMVLFLFVITLLGVHEYPLLGDRLPYQRTLSVIFATLLLLSVVFFVTQSPDAITGATSNFNAALAQGNVQAFGVQLFTTFIFPFEVTPLLLIVAMVGAVALGRRRGTSEGPTPPERADETVVAARPVEEEREMEKVDV